MPYVCQTPYNRDTATGKDRVKSCRKSPYGNYKDLQPCVTECYIGGEGREKSLAHAATTMQSYIKAKKKKTTTNAPTPAPPAPPSYPLTILPSPSSAKKKSYPKKKTGCPAKSRTDCSSPCKWVNGKKHSYCRTSKNRVKFGPKMKKKSYPKKKTGCPAKSRTDCSSPCKWVNGKKYSYCRKEGRQSKK